MLTFPLSMTYDELAAHQIRLDPEFADNNLSSDPEEGYDDTVANFLHSMLDYFVERSAEDMASPFHCSLLDYLRDIGFRVYEDRVEVASEEVLKLTDALLHRVGYEYDALEYTDRPPTWELFNIRGDDSVDYYSSQPTYVTALLMTLLGEEA